MTALGLVAWLMPAVLLMAWGLLAAVMDRRSGATYAGIVLTLAGVMLALAALVRHLVLPTEALVTLVQVVVLVTVLVLVAVVMEMDRESS